MSPILLWAIVSTVLALVALVCFITLFAKIMRMPGGGWKEVIGSDSVPAAIVEEFALDETTDETEPASDRDDGDYLDARKEAEDSLLQRLRGYMEKEGVSTVDVLRTLFPNQLVVYSNNRYYFEEIDHSLPANEYGDSYFTENADGTWAYEDDNGVIGHPGIDVSRFQGEIDWGKASSEIEFAILRLGFRGYTEGAIVDDETFEANIQGALENNLHVGVYFLTQAKDADEIDEEAAYVLDVLKDYGIDGPVVLDVESVANGEGRTSDLTKEERTALIRRFTEKISEAGHKPMLYTNLKSMVLMMNYKDLADIPLWYAFYSRPIYFPYAYDILQYSESGHVDGITEPVDLNLAMKPWWED